MILKLINIQRAHYIRLENCRKFLKILKNDQAS